ncbi:hypothetical protein [Curtobacterium sp. 458]|uniref:hypothetical protein n=1 Tax=Curtobacterium sp. 458 TaxID=3050069 RepID=UPI0025B3F97A|nr:hypothetical protein [Curtobacterium sp. 458]WJX98568.1 hypothetical protein QPJ90_09430 [Curtobacterium sp. 458]
MTTVLWLLVGLGAAMLIAGTLDGETLIVATGAICALPGAWAAVRAPSVRVQLTDDHLRYQGWFVSWTAPRRSIAVVLDDATVEWRDGRGVGRRRHMPLLAQAWEDGGTKFAPLWRWRREGLLAVREWAGARAV